MLSTLAPIIFPSRAPPLFQDLKLWTRDITEQSKQYVKVFYHRQTTLIYCDQNGMIHTIELQTKWCLQTVSLLAHWLFLRAN